MEIKAGDIIQWYADGKPTSLIVVVLSVRNSNIYFTYGDVSDGYGINHCSQTDKEYRWEIIG